MARSQNEKDQADDIWDIGMPLRVRLSHQTRSDVDG